MSFQDKMFEIAKELYGPEYTLTRIYGKDTTDFDVEKRKLLKDTPKKIEDFKNYDCKTLCEKFATLTSELEERPIKLNFQRFRYGFSYFMGFIEEDPKDAFYQSVYHKPWVAVEWVEGILWNHVEELKELKIPLKDNNGKWFVPKITKRNELDPPTGSMLTGQYIDMLIERRDVEKLKALKPYEEEIEACNENTYKKYKNSIGSWN